MIASGRWLLALAAVLLPIYLWGSGGMQLSHFFIALYCAWFVARNGISAGLADGVLLALFAFILVREGLAIFFGAPVGSILPAAHLLFALMVFNVLRRSTASDKVSSALTIGLYGSCLVAVAGVLLLGYGLTVDAEGGRAIGTFNNPNQLGYFSVCMFSAAVLLRMRGKLPVLALAAIVLSCFFLSVASLSKAAMISVGFGAALLGYAFSTKRRLFVVGVFVLVAVVWIGYSLYSSGALDSFAFVRRLQGLGMQGDDSLEGRGYFANTAGSVAELYFGLGYEGVLNAVGHEVHSTVFTFFVTYGLLGGLAISFFLFLWARSVYRAHGVNGVLLVVAPPMVYGIGHNGSRFTIFWILVALSFAALPAKVQAAARPRTRVARSPGPGMSPPLPAEPAAQPPPNW